MGFDVGGPASVSAEMFKEIVQEERNAEIEEAKEKLRKLLKQAMGLRKQKVNLDKEYSKQSAKF